MSLVVRDIWNPFTNRRGSIAQGLYTGYSYQDGDAFIVDGVPDGAFLDTTKPMYTYRGNWEASKNHVLSTTLALKHGGYRDRNTNAFSAGVNGDFVRVLLPALATFVTVDIFDHVEALQFLGTFDPTGNAGTGVPNLKNPGVTPGDYYVVAFGIEDVSYNHDSFIFTPFPQIQQLGGTVTYNTGDVVKWSGSRWVKDGASALSVTERGIVYFDNGKWRYVQEDNTKSYRDDELVIYFQSRFRRFSAAKVQGINGRVGDVTVLHEDLEDMNNDVADVFSIPTKTQPVLRTIAQVDQSGTRLEGVSVGVRNLVTENNNVSRHMTYRNQIPLLHIECDPDTTTAAPLMRLTGSQGGHRVPADLLTVFQDRSRVERGVEWSRFTHRILEFVETGTLLATLQVPELRDHELSLSLSVQATVYEAETYLPTTVSTFLGTWDAVRNLPTLQHGDGNEGDFYVCESYHHSTDVYLTFRSLVLSAVGIVRHATFTTTIVTVDGQPWDVVRRSTGPGQPLTFERLANGAVRLFLDNTSLLVLAWPVSENHKHPTERTYHVAVKQTLPVNVSYAEELDIPVLTAIQMNFKITTVLDGYTIYINRNPVTETLRGTSTATSNLWSLNEVPREMLYTDILFTQQAFFETIPFVSGSETWDTIRAGGTTTRLGFVYENTETQDVRLYLVDGVSSPQDLVLCLPNADLALSPATRVYRLSTQASVGSETELRVEVFKVQLYPHFQISANIDGDEVVIFLDSIGNAIATTTVSTSRFWELTATTTDPIRIHPYHLLYVNATGRYETLPTPVPVSVLQGTFRFQRERDGTVIPVSSDTDLETDWQLVASITQATATACTLEVHALRTAGLTNTVHYADVHVHGDLIRNQGFIEADGTYWTLE